MARTPPRPGRSWRRLDRPPPETLYRGTATRFLPAIRREGLRPGRRTHVHLSADEATATAVGRRHGAPVVLRVAAGAMHRDGHQFVRSANGVWLTTAVAPGYLTGPDGSGQHLADEP